MKQMFTISLFFIVFFATAQPGTNDPFFGINGVVIRKGIVGAYQDLYVLPNNKILAIRGYGDTIVTIIQHTTTGIPQKNTTLSVYIQGPYQNKKGTFNIILPQPDGKFLAAGRMYDLETTMFVARFNNNGLVDSSFGTNGVASYNQGDFSTVKDLIVLPDNKILFGVQVVYDAVPEIDIPTILKYLPDGTPDASFGVNGVVSNVTGYGRMRIQNDGKVILTTTNQGKIQLSRRNTDGSLDLAFGNNGFALIKFPYAKDNFFPGILAVQPDNKIIMAGRADIYIPSTSYTFCARTNADGTLDNSFGNEGFIRSPINSPDTYISPGALIIQPDGKLVIGGELRSYGLPDPDSSFLARFNTDGIPDASWGNNGYIKRPYTRGYSIFGIALQPDGKIVTCGSQVKYDKNGYFIEDHPSIARFIVTGDEFKNQVENIAENKIKMYPNPVTDILYLQPAADINIVKVEIANSMGRILLTQQINEDIQIIPVKVKSLNQGIYYVCTIDKTGKITSTILNKN